MASIRRLIATATTAALLASFPPPTPASAQGDETPIGNANFITADIPGSWQRYPMVTYPGHESVVQVGLSSFGPGSRVTVTASLTCWDSEMAKVSRVFPSETVWVPPDPEQPIPNPSSAERTVTINVATPESCVPIAHTGVSDGDMIFDVHLAVPGFEPWGSTGGLSQIGKPFIRSNIRYNLDLRQDISDALLARYQAHHTLPQRFRGWFESRGFVIDDPVYLRWWCSKPGVQGNHPSMWRNYNRRWSRFIEDHPEATRKQILAFRKTVQNVDEYRYVCPGDQLPPAPVPYYRTVPR